MKNYFQAGVGLMEVGAGLVYAYAPIPYPDHIWQFTIDRPVVSFLAFAGGLSVSAYGIQEIHDGLLQDT
jgi:hypothetical protein